MFCNICTTFERDDVTGNSHCSTCGKSQEYDNFEANLGSIREGPQGTYISIGTIGIGSSLAYKEKKIYEAKNIIDSITERLNLSYRVNEVKKMVSEISKEFGQGEWFPVLVGACCYAVVRREGKCVLTIEEVAVCVGCDLRQLGSMVKRVVGYLGLEFTEFDLVGLFVKTARGLDSYVCGQDKKERVLKQGVFLVNCCVKWCLSTGRSPMPLVVAVLAFVFEVNGVKSVKSVKIDELAKGVGGVSLKTCKDRYRELLVKLVEVAKEVGLPWWRDVNVKNVVKHSGALLGLMEAKSKRTRKRIEGKDDELVRTDEFWLEDLVRDCLSRDNMYYSNDDGQDNMSRYLDVGREENQLTLCNESDDGVHGETNNNRSMWEKRSAFPMVSSEDWWKGDSKLSQKLLLEDLLEKDVGLETLPISYIKGCDAVKRRREKINAAKLRINTIRDPSKVVSQSSMVASEFKHSRKKRKIGSDIDWEDLVIQTLLLHNVNDEEIEKGHYKQMLGLHVFNS